MLYSWRGWTTETCRAGAQRLRGRTARAGTCFPYARQIHQAAKWHKRHKMQANAVERNGVPSTHASSPVCSCISSLRILCLFVANRLEG